MKKLLFFFLVTSLTVLHLDAQKPKDLFKSAEGNMKDFIKDPSANMGAYQEALTSFEAAFANQEFASDPENWIKKGELYTALADIEVKNRLLNPGSSMPEPEAAIIAYHAFEKALGLAKSKNEKGDIKDAVQGIENLEGHLSNIAVELYREKLYDMAFENFDASIQARSILNQNDRDSRLDDKALYNDQIFFTAVSGFFGGKEAEAIPYLEMIIDSEEIIDDPLQSNKPFAFEALYKAYSDLGQKEKALKFLNQGREMFPDDTGLLFSEINYYLESGQNEVLIDKLKLAREKEPDNLSVLNTLGSVYDKMSVSARESGDGEKADMYFDEAMQYYNAVLEQEPEDFTATYSIGALYYNKAASMTEKINELANDFSKEGTKKYEVLKSEMDGYFDEALPYFLKAESIDGSDLNTLIALREIFARKNQFDKVEEYKQKYQMAASKAESN